MQLASRFEQGVFDVIIDDGSHASFDQQLTLSHFFPLLADGGWYFIEDLDWQPQDEDVTKITPTKVLLRELQEAGKLTSLDVFGIGAFADRIAEVLFFDSYMELERAKLIGGLVAIHKRGAVPARAGTHIKKRSGAPRVA